MNIRKRILLILVLTILPVIVITLYHLRYKIIEIGYMFPVCNFYEKTGYLCPACGNTRSVIALLNGRIIDSLGYNITPLLLVILCIFYYIENIFILVGKSIHLIPRKFSFLACFFTFLCVYYISRNFITEITLCL